MNCPICQTPGIDNTTKVCPECQSNLESFSHIDHIGQKIKKQRSLLYSLASIIVLLVVASLVLYFLFHGHRSANAAGSKDTESAEIQNLKEENNGFRETINKLNSHIKELESEIANATSKTDSIGSSEEESVGTTESTGKDITTEAVNSKVEGSSETTTNGPIEGSYTVKKGETLFSIAEKLYGNGWKYKEIAKKNQIDDPNHIFPGQILTTK